MEVSQLLWEGATLMMIGMGSVFTFLGILIFLIHLIARLVPEEAEDAGYEPRGTSLTAPAPARDGDLVAVVSAAVAQYRADNGQTR